MSLDSNQQTVRNSTALNIYKLYNLKKRNKKINKINANNPDSVQVATPIIVESLLAIPYWFYNIGDE